MKTYCFDIDGTICTETECDLENAEPIQSRISAINRLHTEGNKIVLMTARGMIDSKNDQQLADSTMRTMTEHQLKKWGVLYDELYFGKPRCDFYIDDRGWSDSDFFRQF
jgi:capsule biosynthesis phosphatase